MHGRVVPLKDPLSCAQFRPDLLKYFKKGAQGLDDVVCVDSLTPGDIVGVHVHLVVKEGQDLLLALPSMDLGLIWTLCPPRKTLL
jgi:hypothetical protein